MSDSIPIPRQFTDEIRVLHVDDNAELGEMVVAFLERANDRLAVETVTTVRDALARLDESHFDCVVSDYDIAETNGIEFLETLRATRPTLPFVLYTGKGSEEVASRALSAGATDYFQKETGTDHYSVLENRIVTLVERERAQAETDDIQHLFTELADSMDDILWLYTHDWDELVFLSSAYEDVFGQPRARLETDPTAFLDAFHPADRSRVEAAMNRLTDGESATVEARVTDGDDVRWAWIKGAPITDSTGRVTHIGGFSRDVTRKKLREQELETTNAQLEAAMEAGGVGTWQWDIRTDTVTVGSALARTFGIDADETPVKLPLKRFVSSIHEDDRARVEADIDEALANAGPYETEFRVRNGDGDIRWVIARGHVMCDGEDTPRRFPGLVIDVTERTRNQAELERALALMERAEQIADVGGWEIDVDTTDVFWSENLFAILDREGEEPPLDEALDVYHEADRPRIERALETALETGEPFDVEARFRRPSGEIRWLRVQGSPTMHDGEVVTLRGAVQDITDHKSYQQTLERQNARLDEFASVVSHDLRNPLQVAAGNVELARTETDNEYLDRIDAALDRANRIIDNVLLLARNGRDIGSVSAVDLAATTGAAWEVTGRGHEHATLSVRPDEGLDRVEADAERLQQLFENVFRNSLEHGGPDVAVTVGSLPDGFYVEDDGPGIPAEKREQVFTPGYSTSEDGTGFGLAIVKRIAEAHGWAVTATTGATGGTRFEVTGVTRP